MYASPRSCARAGAVRVEVAGDGRALGEAVVGVVGPGFDPTGGVPACNSPQGWGIHTYYGELYQASRYSRWEGQPQYPNQLKQGDVVAEVGRTGNVERPQLHFELRKGTRAVNPQSLN